MMQASMSVARNMIALASLVIATASVNAETKSLSPLVFGADEFCPFNCAPGKSPEGIMLDISREALKPSGRAIEYRAIPWKRALADALSGKIDGVLAASPEEAAGLVLVDEPYGGGKTCFYARNDAKFSYKDLSSLDTAKLAIVDGYTYGAELDAYIAKHRKDSKRIFVSNSEEAMSDNLKMLKGKRVDLVVESANVMDYKARFEKVPIHRVGCTKDTVPLYIALSPKLPDVAAWSAKLSEGLRAARADGRLKKMLAVYGIEDWK